MLNTCVCCGAVIPEGRQVCPNCLVTAVPPMTNQEWIQSMSLGKLARFLCLMQRECDEDCPGYEHCKAGQNGMVVWLKARGGYARTEDV